MNAKPRYGWKNHRPVYSDVNVEMMARMYRAGSSYEEIAKAIGSTSAQSIKSELARRGIRRPGRPGVIPVNVGERREAVLRQLAKKHGVNVAVFGADLLKKIVDDGLIDAVLDESGEERAIRARRRN